MPSIVRPLQKLCLPVSSFSAIPQIELNLYASEVTSNVSWGSYSDDFYLTAPFVLAKQPFHKLHGQQSIRYVTSEICIAVSA